MPHTRNFAHCTVQMKWKHNGNEYERNNSSSSEKNYSLRIQCRALCVNTHVKNWNEKKNICIEDDNELQHFAAFTSSDNRSQMNVPCQTI